MRRCENVLVYLLIQRIMSSIAQKLTNASHSFKSIFENFLSEEKEEENSIDELNNFINSEDKAESKTAKTLKDSLIAINKIENSYQMEPTKTTKKPKAPSLKNKVINSEITENKMKEDNERSR